MVPYPLFTPRLRDRRFGHVTYVTVAVKSGKLMRLLSERFAIVEKIRYQAAGKEEENIAKDPNAVMSRERWPAPWYKVRGAVNGY